MTPAETTGSDAELIGLARSGDDAAFAVLVARHRDAARDAAARRTGGFSGRADDVVAAAVTRMRDTLRAGFGPVEAFRPYLLTLVCRLAHASDLDAALAADVGPIPLFAPGTEHADAIVETEESRVFAGAYLSLPERWQALLWHRAVDGEDAAGIAALLGRSPQSVDALALCAREDLRASVLAAHESPTEVQDCPLSADLAPFVRGSLGRRALHRFEDHTPSCPSCRSALAHLDDVESAVVQLVAPLFLWAPAAAPVAPLIAAAPARRSAVLVGAGVAVAAVLVLGSGALAATSFLDSPAETRMATAAGASDGGSLQPGQDVNTQPGVGGATDRTASPEQRDADEPDTEEHVSLEDRVEASTPEDSDHTPTESDGVNRPDDSAADAPDAEHRVEAAGNRDNAPGRSSDRPGRPSEHPGQGARPDGGRPGPAVVAPSERPGIAPNPRPDRQQVPSSHPTAPPVAPRPTPTYRPAPKTSSAPIYKPAPKPSPTPTRTYAPAPKPSPSPTRTYAPAPKPSPSPTKTYKPAPKPSPTPTPKPSPTQAPEENCLIDLLGIKVCL